MSEPVKSDYSTKSCEHVLAHRLPDHIEAAYLQFTYLKKRKGLMTDWAEFYNQ